MDSERRLRDGGCPHPEIVWAAVKLELPEAARREVVDHLATCPACAEDWRIAWHLMEAEQRGKNDTEEARVVVGPWRRHLPQLTAAAALLALAVGVGFFLQRPQSMYPAGDASAVSPGQGAVAAPNTPAAFRGGGADEAAQSLLPEGAVLPRQGLLLRWTEGPPGSRYEVRVMTEGLDPVATGKDLTEPRYEIPTEAVEGLSAGATLLWQVDTIPMQGTAATSATFTIGIE